jgi:hypothetical protein
MADWATRLDHIMDYQVKSWFGETVPSVVSHPTVQALMARWVQIKDERDPTLADFWEEPERFADSSILFLRSDPEYVYLHHGKALRDRIGFSMQGRSMSELRTRIRANLVEVYDRACLEFTPAYFQSFADFMHEVVLWGRLCLPLRLGRKDQRVVLLVFCHPLADKTAIFKAAFDHSLSSTLIATPIKDGDGNIVDAWIVAQNHEASRITGIVEHATGNMLLRSTAVFARDDVWECLIGRLPGGAAVATVASRRQGSLNLSVELIDDYLVIRATPISESGNVFEID